MTLCYEKCMCKKVKDLICPLSPPISNGNSSAGIHRCSGIIVCSICIGIIKCVVLWSITHD